MNDYDACESCKFYRDEDNESGYCYLNPPVLSTAITDTLDGEYEVSVWLNPIVHQGSFCSHYVIRKKSELRGIDAP
jgi:hypothetical protein